MIDSTDTVDFDPTDEEDYPSEDDGELFSPSAAIAQQVLQRMRSRAPKTKGVAGARITRRDGSQQSLSFPQRLATAAETNRLSASMSARINALELRMRGQSRKEGTVSGGVYLIVGGILFAKGLYDLPAKNLRQWARSKSAGTLAVASGVQLATSGVRAVVNRRYHGSAVGIAADIAALAQLGFMWYGRNWSRTADVKNIADDAARDALPPIIGTTIWHRADRKFYRLIENAAGAKQWREDDTM